MTDYRRRALVLSRRLRALRRYARDVDAVNAFLALEEMRRSLTVYCGLCGAAAKPGLAADDRLVHVCDLCRAVRVECESSWMRPYP